MAPPSAIRESLCSPADPVRGSALPDAPWPLSGGGQHFEDEVDQALDGRATVDKALDGRARSLVERREYAATISAASSPLRA
jgi:hypothetical protein